ncbi:MAG: diiron oxygenase [Candidatus Obscuribacterales bacterium]|nr:diiron oxygenase [Candidatus Obscuribacterales bacterium]
MSKLEETSKKLSAASCKSYQNPYEYLDWPEQLDREQWFFSEELISIYGSPEYESLSESQKKQLSFFEAVNFFSLNIHGEKPLVEGLARRLYSRELKDYADYLHHFLDEENKHMIYFGGFCNRYAGKIYRDKKLQIPRDYEAGEEDFLFFAKVMIFEEIVDVYNLRMAADERLENTSRKINRIHHLDEARHLVFGRQITEHLYEKYSKEWCSETIERLREYLGNYLVATWKEYYNPDVYKDAGLNSPYELMERAWKSQDRIALRQQVSASLIKYLRERNLIGEEIQL